MNISIPIGLYAVTAIAWIVGLPIVGVAFLGGMAVGATKLGDGFTVWTWPR